MKLLLNIISSNPNLIRSFQIALNEEGATIGRSKANTVVLVDPKKYISSFHAGIEFQVPNYILTDTSANGILINSSPLGKGNSRRLRDGDELQIGDAFSVKYTISVKLIDDGIKIDQTPNSKSENPFDIIGSVVPSILDIISDIQLNPHGSGGVDFPGFDFDSKPVNPPPVSVNLDNPPVLKHVIQSTKEQKPVALLPDEMRTDGNWWGIGSRSKNEEIVVDIIKRYPNILLKEKIVIHERIPLLVAITKKPTNKKFEKYGMEMEFQPNQNNVEIDIFITANNFEFVGTEYQTIIVPKNQDSKTVLFWLKPYKMGEQKVKVEFFQNNKYIGGLTVTTVVIEADSNTENHQSNRDVVQGVIQINNNISSPDLTLLITKDTEQEKYYFTLHSPQNALNFYRVREPLVFSGSVTQYIESLSKELETIYKNNKAEDIPATLNTIGMDLYDKLFSKKIKRYLEN